MHQIMVLLGKENFPKLYENTLDTIRSILNNQIQVFDKDLIKKLSDSLNLYKITGKNKIRRSDVIDEVNQIDRFIAVIKQIHESKNQKLIDQIIENHTIRYIIDLFMDINIKKHGKYSDLYSHMLVDSFLKNDTISIMTDNYLDPTKKRFIGSHYIFLNLIIIIRDIVNKSPTKMCEKYWQSNLVDTLKKIYYCVFDDDVCTKSNCFNIIKLFIDNNYYDQQICDFLLQCLCINEANSIHDGDDKYNYSNLISDVCDTVNELLIKHKKSEISRSFIRGIVTNCIIENLEDIVDKKYHFVVPLRFGGDGPKKLLDTIKSLDNLQIIIV